MIDFLQAQVKGDDEATVEERESETCWQQGPHRDTCFPVSGFAEGNKGEEVEASLFSHVSWLTVDVVEAEEYLMITSGVGGAQLVAPIRPWPWHW